MPPFRHCAGEQGSLPYLEVNLQPARVHLEAVLGVVLVMLRELHSFGRGWKRGKGMMSDVAGLRGNNEGEQCESREPRKSRHRQTWVIIERRSA